MSAEELVEDARAAASRAITFDKQSQLSIAAFHYAEAARFLELAARLATDDKARAWREKAAEYVARKEEIDEELRDTQKMSAQSEDQNQLQKCRFLMSQALDADEAGLQEQAVELYAQAVENALKTKNQTTDPDIKKKLGSLALHALDRAEVLKKETMSSSTAQQSVSSTPTHSCVSATASDTISSVNPSPSRPPPTGRPELHRGYSSHLKVVGGSDTYTDEEKRVLLATSKINGLEYVPFMSIDLQERFRYAIPFSDKDPPLALSPKQKQSFHRWARPQELCSEPVLVANKMVDFYCIKQTVISDCSLVASLAVSAQYERRFNQRLITSVIYPRNKSKEPIINPFGKYMVKLHLNGVPRKVIIDDLLPVGRHGELLCSYSTNRNELWVSLIEKAYMKVMGGYDFPGSNSNIDLHALTGWIPERVAIRPKQEDFNASQVFQMLETSLREGKALITIATGDLPEIEADRAGLVPAHAYAVLDVRRVNGVSLMKLKNPWSHLRWRGNYSELDTRHWTPYLKEALNYDPNCAATFDNGVFWIDYESILRFFDVFYLNWNPKLFKYTYCIHQSWKAGLGPVKDVYNIGENPQFRLEVGPGTGEVWLLLTRHIVDIVDFKDNREYITVLVYKTSGGRVFYPDDPPPYLDGIRINSPHYLSKIKFNETTTTSRVFTLVISQYEKMNTIYYTLRAYSTLPFKLNPLRPVGQYKREESGVWKGPTAGGCANYPETYPKNPRYQLVIESSNNENKIVIDLKGPKQYQVGFDLRPVILNDSNAQMKKKSSGPFRSGFVALDLENVPAGTYELIVSTFYPNLEGPYILTVKSSSPFKLGRL